MSIKTKISTCILKNDLILYTMSSEKFFHTRIYSYPALRQLIHLNL